MNNIFTIIDELLDSHIDEEFEISDLAYAPTMTVTVKQGATGWDGEVTEEVAKRVMENMQFAEILPAFERDLSIGGYVIGDKFYLFALFLDGREVGYKYRCSFIELYNSTPFNVKMSHVPVNPTILKLDGAKRALENGSDRELVKKYTIQAITDLAAGPCPLTGGFRKGLVFKSLTSDFAFKAYSEQTMMMGSL